MAEKKMSRDEWAAKYGLAWAVLESDPGLKSVFGKAVAGKWTPEKFTAELRKTNWYKTHGESWRQTEALRLTDKATYKANVAQNVSSLRALAAQMGATLTGAQISELAESFYRFGYSETQARATIARYVGVHEAGTLRGEAQSAAEKLRAIAVANGQRYSDNWYLKAARGVTGGTQDIATYEAQIRADAAGTYKMYKDRILAGEDMSDIASNYINRYAQILEVDPQSIKLSDRLIDAALTGTTPDGKPAVQSMSDFTKALKADPRWKKTDNARDEIAGTMYSIGRMMGFA